MAISKTLNDGPGGVRQRINDDDQFVAGVILPGDCCKGCLQEGIAPTQTKNDPGGGRCVMWWGKRMR